MNQKYVPCPTYDPSPSSFNHPGSSSSSPQYHLLVDPPGESSGTLKNVWSVMKFEAKKIKTGRKKNIFKQKFGEREGENLLKASHCFLSIRGRGVTGLLFISTERIAFCSERSMTVNFPNPQFNEADEPVKIEIPLRNIKRNDLGNPQQKNILIRTEDNSEFRFTAFLRYGKARQKLEEALCQGR